MKKIALIGSTGSIGRQTVDVVLRHPDRFCVVALAADRNETLLAEQAALLRPQIAVLRSEGREVGMPEGVRFSRGEGAFEAACAFPEADIVVVAVTGFAGLKAALLAIGAGKDVALANKESLVAGGELLLGEAVRRGVNVCPVDSEHSAIWQCLHFDRGAPYTRILLTASGGALRDVPLEDLPKVTPAQALAHPTWKMGPKITIDCATMLNKGFEVIEAMRLYGAAPEQVEVIVHRESIVHSLVEFADGALLAQMSLPSMELPIQLALTYPERLDAGLSRLDLCALGALHFEAPDLRRYPCLRLSLESARAGGLYPAALGGAGEVAVEAFLNGQIKYTDIADIIECALGACEGGAADSYAHIAAADAAARAAARAQVKRIAEGK